MRLGNTWEREFKWPKSGPVHWLTLYFVGVIFAGVALWQGLSFTSPRAPDPAAGRIYEVPGGRRTPTYYVDRIDAYALRFAIAHLALALFVAGAVTVWNAGAKPPQRQD